MAEEKGISRRGFFKGVGAAGAVASVAAVFAEARKAALDPSAYTGWENRRGKEYFDRSAFEVEEPRSYQVVGELKRRDTRLYDTRARVGCPPDEENSVALHDAGDEFWVNYYEENPVDGDGVPTLERDRRYRDEWWPEQESFIESTYERRREFQDQEGFLAAVRATPYRNFPFPRPDKPPEEWDWEGVNTRRAEFRSPGAAAQFIKRLAADYGATLCRITRTNPAWFYADGCRGQEDNPIGTEFEIRPWWETCIVVTRPMNFDTLESDPNYGTSYDGYNPSGYVAWHLGEAIKKLGYPARVASPRQGYEQFAVPFAVDAGFGELGRTCNCVSPDMGGNFRQALIFTNLPLAYDKPVDVGVHDFCKDCMICAEYCQTGAIPTSDDWNWEEAGVRRWDVDGFKCRTGWMMVSGRAGPYEEGDPGRALGGCRACIAVCPWFRKNNWLHNAIRQTLARDPSEVGTQLSLVAERNLYPRNTPDEWVGPEMAGVQEPPEWLRTEDFVEDFVDTPMGEA